jgi:hypothetical protein
VAHFLGPAEQHAALARVAQAVLGALPDEGALELRDAGEYSQNHASQRTDDIRPGFIQGLQAGSLISKSFGND